MAAVKDTQARIVAHIFSSITLNVGQTMILEGRNFKIQDAMLLLFSSPITELCRMDEVEEYLADTWV